MSEKACVCWHVCAGVCVCVRLSGCMMSNLCARKRDENRFSVMYGDGDMTRQAVNDNVSGAMDSHG